MSSRQKHPATSDQQRTDHVPLPIFDFRHCCSGYIRRCDALLATLGATHGEKAR
jgi:hypothetical protein